MPATTKVDYSATPDNIRELFRFRTSSEAKIKRNLWLIGLIIAPVAVMGSLFGYARAYNRFMSHDRKPPYLSDLPPIARAGMWIFGVCFYVAYWLTLVLLYYFLRYVLKIESAQGFFVTVAYFILHLVLCALAFRTFQRWQVGIINMLLEGEKFGTARFAYNDELYPYTQKGGIYIGGGYTFSDKGHVLTVAGTRGGKGMNLIIPNLLGVGGYQGSWVVIDPKGENAAITARYQREQGQKVVILNPWGLLEENIGESHSYNPLDLLADKNSIHLVDDVQIIAEMLVPVSKDEKDKFFSDNARSIVAGLLLHLVTSQEPEKQVLKTIWQWVRLHGDKWNELLADMAVSDHPAYGETVRNAAGEILKLMAAGDNTFGSIMATVLQCTEFLKSPALQKAMQSGFSPQELADGRTTLYVIIPADKLQSHYRWLRLVVTTTMRAVVRKPDKRVTFLLDEFAALGYLPEIETALSTYAGFEITVWAILQSLIQLKGICHDSWETFTANCTIRQYFTVNDNFTADYVSAAIGQTSHVLVKRSWFGVSESQSNARALVTPDEVRRGSGGNIFAFIGANPPTYYPKLPYYEMNLTRNSKKRYDENPYIKN